MNKENKVVSESVINKVTMDCAEISMPYDWYCKCIQQAYEESFWDQYTLSEKEYNKFRESLVYDPADEVRELYEEYLRN